MRTAEIRHRWLEYFGSRDHAVVPSASLISEDPSLLFTVAGMVPFIPYMLGEQTPPWPRATSVQKCVRTLDIDEVGKTTRHGTFFQMNGNFSFGDYFKEQAIAYAWDLITSTPDNGGYGFDPDKIWVTVFHDDDEAAALWRKIADLPDERIQRRGMKDNFWSTGQPGPAGPCSEIYIDRGPRYGQDGGPVVDESRFLEIWNLVFMQYERGEGTSKDDFPLLGELKQKNIDTGMGLERVAFLLQGVDNLYEIDEVFPVIARAEELTGKSYRAASEAGDDTDAVRMRVVADHVRSSLMLIGDGVTPSNEGRGYVLRRLLRRSVRAMRLLGFEDPSIPLLMPVSLDAMKHSYPELERDSERILKIASAEEDAFRRTLVAGTTILDLAVAKAKEAKRPSLGAEEAFALHDTYGFPIDLTLEMAQEQGLSVDETGFRALMKAQRDRARADAMSKKGGHADLSVYRALRDAGATEFTGYQELNTAATVRGIVRNGVSVSGAAQGDVVEVVLDKTSFYAESGGQDSDAGTIVVDGANLEILDVQRPVKGLIVHTVRVGEGEFQVGSAAETQVDPQWRLGARQAHSGTHVLHAALRQVLGPTALQSGSYNKPGYLRLDFSWQEALSAATKSEIEEVTNLAIRQDLPVHWEYMSLPEARERGAVALFGETYDEQVRVVEIGGPWSLELCGGTHVDHSSQIGLVSLTSEGSVGAGSRRLEALVGIEAFRGLAKERAIVHGLAEALKAQPDDVPARVESLLARLKETERELDKLRQAQLLGNAAQLLEGAREIGGLQYLGHDLGSVASVDDVRSLVLDLRQRLGEGSPSVVAIGAVVNERPIVVVATNAAAREAGRKAGQLAKLAAVALGGGGGGKDDLAQGGGSDVGAMPAALDAVATGLLA